MEDSSVIVRVFRVVGARWCFLWGGMCFVLERGDGDEGEGPPEPPRQRGEVGPGWVRTRTTTASSGEARVAGRPTAVPQARGLAAGGAVAELARREPPAPGPQGKRGGERRCDSFVGVVTVR